MARSKCIEFFEVKSFETLKSTQVTCHCQVKSSQVECRFQPQVGSCFCTAATRRSIRDLNMFFLPRLHFLKVLYYYLIYCRILRRRGSCHLVADLCTYYAKSPTCYGLATVTPHSPLASTPSVSRVLAPPPPEINSCLRHVLFWSTNFCWAAGCPSSRPTIPTLNDIIKQTPPRVLSRHLFGGNFSPIFGTPQRSFGQVYSSIKNPVIKLAAVIPLSKQSFH